MSKLLAVLFLFFGIAASAQEPVLQEDLSLKYMVQLPVEKSLHTPVVILLHGYGADERDLFELRTLFPKHYLIVSPRAPYALQGAGYEWYEGIMVDGKRDGKQDQLENSKAKIIQFIKEITSKYKAAKDAVYVVGFSQGAIMSYEVGMSVPGKVKGIAPLSGMIFASHRAAVKITPALKKLKIFVAHGTADDRIKFKDGKETVEYLKSIGLNPEFHAYEGMGHSIGNEVMRDLLMWMR